MRKTRRYASLIEVLIAMVLTSLVLMTLLFFYQQVSVINTNIDKLKAIQFQFRYVENRLSSIFSRAVGEKKKKKDFIFFSFNDEGIGLSESQNLIFIFDNVVSQDKLFSNHVIARLFVDKEGRLTLAYWPLPRRVEGSVIPMKKEILLEGVKSLNLEFFIPPEKAGEASLANSENPSPEPKGAWRRQLWLKEYQKLPAMVKVVIGLTEGHQKEAMTFAFPLSGSSDHVIYD